MIFKNASLNLVLAFRVKPSDSGDSSDAEIGARRRSRPDDLSLLQKGHHHGHNSGDRVSSLRPVCLSLSHWVSDVNIIVIPKWLREFRGNST